MKVDTNTKGNSFWFYFKVSNLRENQCVKFNILNFSRDIKYFYERGMSIMTKIDNNESNSNWENNLCHNIEFK
jgi:hypothetical protein